jgi:hypothetical protein
MYSLSGPLQAVTLDSGLCLATDPLSLGTEEKHKALKQSSLMTHNSKEITSCGWLLVNFTTLFQ